MLALFDKKPFYSVVLQITKHSDSFPFLPSAMVDIKRDYSAFSIRGLGDISRACVAITSVFINTLAGFWVTIKTRCQLYHCTTIKAIVISSPLFESINYIRLHYKAITVKSLLAISERCRCSLYIQNHPVIIPIRRYTNIAILGMVAESKCLLFFYYSLIYYVQVTYFFTNKFAKWIIIQNKSLGIKHFIHIAVNGESTLNNNSKTLIAIQCDNRIEWQFVFYLSMMAMHKHCITFSSVKE